MRKRRVKYSYSGRIPNLASAARHSGGEYGFLSVTADVSGLRRAGADAIMQVRGSVGAQPCRRHSRSGMRLGGAALLVLLQ